MPPTLVDAMDRATGALAVAGTSLNILLYLGSAALLASYDGSLLPEDRYRSGTNRFAKTTAIWMLQHFLGLPVWLSVYASRWETEILSVTTRTLTWYGVIAVPLIGWITILLLTEQGYETGTSWMGDPAFVLGFVTIAFIPWIALRFA